MSDAAKQSNKGRPPREAPTHQILFCGCGELAKGRTLESIGKNYLEVMGADADPKPAYTYVQKMKGRYLKQLIRNAMEDARPIWMRPFYNGPPMEFRGYGGTPTPQILPGLESGKRGRPKKIRTPRK